MRFRQPRCAVDITEIDPMQRLYLEHKAGRLTFFVAPEAHQSRGSKRYLAIWRREDGPARVCRFSLVAGKYAQQRNEGELGYLNSPPSEFQALAIREVPVAIRHGFAGWLHTVVHARWRGGVAP